MVFKPLLGVLARQTFAKTLAHGYAQSVVAATQSSYASATTLPLVWNGPHATGKAYNAFSGSNAGGRADYSTSQGSGSGPISQYAVFHRDHDDEWQHKQAPHQRRLRLPSSIAKEGEKDVLSKPTIKRRSASTSCVREFSTSANVAQVEEAVVDGPESSLEQAMSIDDASAHVSSVNQAQQVPDRQTTTEDAAIADATAAAAAAAASTSSSASTANKNSSPTESATSPVEKSTSSVIEDANSDLSGQTLVNISKSHSSVEGYLSTMEKLKKHGEFGQVRRLFHQLLDQKLTPTIAVFDYLLHAVTQLHLTGKERLTTLEGYYDHMVSLNLKPSDFTYSILIAAFADGAESDYKTIQKYETAERRCGGFLLPGDRYILDETRQSSSMETAMALFAAASELKHKLSKEAFNLLMISCAQRSDLQSLVSVLGYMESLGVTPTLEAYGEMIRAFGRDHDITSAVDCYKAASAQAALLESQRPVLAGGIEANALETFSLPDQVQNLTALNLLLAQAYVLAGEEDEGVAFLDKAIQNGYGIDSNVVATWIANALLFRGDLDGCLGWALQLDKHEIMTQRLLDSLCGALADAGRAEAALKVFKRLASARYLRESAIDGMISMYLRLADLDSARAIIDIALEKKYPSSSFNNFATLYALRAIETGRVDEGIEYFVMGMLRAYASDPAVPSPADLTESISAIISAMNTNGTFSQLQSLALMSLFDGLRSTPPVPIARNMLAPFEGVPPEALTVEHFHLLVLPQSVVAQSPDASPEELGKLEYMLDFAIHNRLPLWNFPASLVEKRDTQRGLHNMTLEEQVLQSPFNLQGHWRVTEEIGPAFKAIESNAVPPMDVDKLFDDHDPYAEGLNVSKSQALNRFIEDKSHERGTNYFRAKDHIFTVFSGLRGTTTHLQPHVVAKALQYMVKEPLDFNKTMIGAEKKSRDVTYRQLRAMFNTALAPIPFRPDSKKVRYAWYIIYDAMISACLQNNSIIEAEEYRDQMLRMGASPSANTYGLFIVHLKSNPNSYDEATEAVKIFERTKKENVAPSSFLYNALIGKLSKARRIDDCLMYFSEMRALGIRPTSVTYGTIVNALCRVSDQRFAEELFEEMESMPNYKPRPAPYNSMIQYFAHTKQDQASALKYYNRMLEKGILPSPFTYKLVMDAYICCEPYNTQAAVGILEDMKKRKIQPAPIHFSSLISGLGVAQQDLEAARVYWNDALNSRNGLTPDPAIFQSWAEALNANGKVEELEDVKMQMQFHKVKMTPYIANALINGWATKGDIKRAEAEYAALAAGKENLREPSTYEAMAKAYETVGDHDSAMTVVNEMAGRLYPAPVLTKVMDIIRAEGKYDTHMSTN